MEKKGLTDLIKPYLDRRYKTISTYRVDRWIVITGMIFCFLFLLYVANSYNYDLDYYSCPLNSDGSITGSKIMLEDHKPETKEGFCKNPFYSAPDWKNEQYLPPGEYGTKLGNDFKYAWLVVWSIMILAFIGNHFIHNRGKNIIKILKEEFKQ
jgi:hypothetical protein